MGSKKKAPPPPDYSALAKEQADLANQQLQQQIQANRPTQITPMGKMEWSQDPETGQWTQTETWDPRMQQSMDELMGLQTSQLGQIKDLMGQGGFQGGPALPTYDPATAEQYSKDFAESLLARVRPQQAQEQEAMATKLRLQGLQPGTEAYDRAYRNLLTSQGDVTAQAQLQAQLAGAGEARAMYESQLGGQQQGFGQQMQQYLLPWQTAQMTQGLTSGIRTPQFSGFTQAGLGESPRVMDVAQQQYAQQMQQFNEAAQKKQGKGQGIGSIVGGIGGAFFGMPQVGAALGGAVGGGLASDIALKDDIEEMSDEECYDLMLEIAPISWRWKGTDVRDAGLSAQAVQELAPDLVRRAEKGLLKVNYTRCFAILLGAFRHMAKREAANG